MNSSSGIIPIDLKYSTLCQFSKTFCNHLYLPDFQRVYEWSDDNALSFVEGVVSSLVDGKAYSFGTMSIMRCDEEHYYLLDGQQRYVTFIIMCRVLLDKLRELYNEYISTGKFTYKFKLNSSFFSRDTKLQEFLISNSPIRYERDSIDSEFMLKFLSEATSENGHYDYLKDDKNIKSIILRIYNKIDDYFNKKIISLRNDGIDIFNFLFSIVDGLFYDGEIGRGYSSEIPYAYFGVDLCGGEKEDAYKLYFGINTIRQDFSKLQKIKLRFFTKIKNFADRERFSNQFDNMCYKEFSNDDKKVLEYMDYIFKVNISASSAAYPYNSINEDCVQKLSSEELDKVFNEMFISNNISEYKDIILNGKEINSVFSVNNEIGALYNILYFVHMPQTNHFYCVFIKRIKDIIRESKNEDVEKYLGLMIIYYIFLQFICETQPANYLRETLRNVLLCDKDNISGMINIISSDIKKMCSGNNLIKEKLRTLQYGNSNSRRNLLKVILSINAIDNNEKDYYVLLNKEIINSKLMQLDHKCAQGLFEKYGISNEVGNCIGNLKLCGERTNKSKGCSNDYNTEENVSELIMKDFEEEYNKFSSSRLLQVLEL